MMYTIYGGFDAYSSYLNILKGDPAMKLLEEKILSDGVVLQGNVLKVDGFLSQMIDAPLAYKMAEEWKRLFEGEKITKIVTIEASGIGLACIAGVVFGVPIVYAKKSKSTPPCDVYSSTVVSYTHGTNYNVTIPKKYLEKGDKILLIDDFLANGSAMRALVKICQAAEAAIVGAGVAIEKCYIGGADNLREQGFRIESLARIKKIDDINGIQFV